MPPALTFAARWVRRTLLIVPFIAPFLFHALYESINRNWTVEQFGCGCPNIRGEFRRFNANDFNLIVWSVVWCICGTLWILLLRPDFKTSTSLKFIWVAAPGLAILAYVCLNRWSREFWI
ncbi:MAG: hypothetical protein QM770_21705 [Tepidisphaeraceae bacterium]